MTDPLAPRIKQLLNGWWDLQPVPHDDLSVPLVPSAAPTDGWAARAYLVPGFFTDHPYPEAWRASRSAWTRTRFPVADLSPDRRAYLTVGAAIPKAHIFVNGRKVAEQDDMFIGDEIDVTAALHPGENELAVFLTEHQTFPHPQTGELKLVDVPWGCCIAQGQAGIWQDVTLEWRSAVHIADVTIVTSVREGRIAVTCEAHNAGHAPFVGVLAASVREGDRAVLSLPPVPLRLAPGETQRLTLAAGWADFHPWQPEDPHLYRLVAELRRDGQVVDALATRFGFREVWIEGHRILLNGRPQRWYGEWCHKAHAHWLRPEYVRQWYRQLRDGHMNYVRMHTFPHPEYFLDIADEMGILVCQEIALYGSFEGALDTPNLWPRAAAHVRRMVRRDKNHPSLVIWSVENEMRWALRTMPAAVEELPKLRRLFNELDPTRPAFHEGDSAIWNEKQQPIISRHYGPACHGWGWWERDRPLHAGEMGRWHYGSPFTALLWAGDEVYADYEAMCRSIAQDAARIIELGRANEVSCLFIWNTSGLDNFRPAEARAFAWPDPQTPYAKPLAHRPYESEYAWWQEGPGYRPGPSFEIVRRAQRPLAVVIWQERTQFYADRSVAHRCFVVNDLPHAVAGRLSVRLEQDGRTLWEDGRPLVVPAGGTAEATWRAPLDAVTLDVVSADGRATLVTRFECADGADEVQRPLRVVHPRRRTDPLRLPAVGVWGGGAIVGWLAGHGVTPRLLDRDALPDPADVPIVVVGEGSVAPDSPIVQRFHDYVAGGGGLLVLEQTHSLFPGLALARMPTEMAHVRDAGHPVLAGIGDADLRFFGDDPFGLPSSDSWVTLYPYVKPTDGHLVRPLVDSSGGDFGIGGLAWAPVIEARVGAGTVIASQLRLADRLDELPVGDRLLRNALEYLAAAARAATSRPVMADAALRSTWPDGLELDLTPWPAALKITAEDAEGAENLKVSASSAPSVVTFSPAALKITAEDAEDAENLKVSAFSAPSAVTFSPAALKITAEDAEDAENLKVSAFSAPSAVTFSPAALKITAEDAEDAENLKVSASSAPSAVVLVSGERPPDLPADHCRRALEEGATVIVWGLAEAGRSYWEAVSGRRIALFEPEHAAYQLVKTQPDPLTAAISHEDICWIENWPYRRNQPKEVIVDRLLTVAGGENLLENATRSGLDVLFGDDQASERTRMVAMSAYFEAPPPAVGGGLVRLAVGHGQLIFCQIRWRPDKPQFRRILGLLLWNLGVRAGTDVLAGERTPTAGKRSDGYPTTLRVARGLDAAALAGLVETATRRVEYCSDNMTFRNWPGWQSVEAPAGRVTAAAVAGTGPIVIGLEVHSSEPRKFTETVGGLPNPDLQTSLALAGGGRIRAWINGADRGELVLAGAGRIADIDFEAGANLVLLAWEPPAPDASLALRFEDRAGRPEITFKFV